MPLELWADSVSPRWPCADRTQIDPFCVPPPIDMKESHRIQNGGNARSHHIVDVTLGNSLALESGRSQLAHRTALLCPGRQQTLKRTYQRRPARTRSGR